MSKITKSARGQECQVRIPGVCNHNSETVVFAHIGGGGMGTKHPDCEGAYCCSSCHDVIDGRATLPKSIYIGDCITLVKLYHHEGAMKTRKILLDAGLIKLS